MPISSSDSSFFSSFLALPAAGAASAAAAAATGAAPPAGAAAPAEMLISSSPISLPAKALVKTESQMGSTEMPAAARSFLMFSSYHAMLPTIRKGGSTYADLDIIVVEGQDGVGNGNFSNVGHV